MSNAMDNLLDEASDILSIHLGVFSTRGYFELCGSPIEQAFLAAADMSLHLEGAHLHVGMPTDLMKERAAETKLLEVFIKPQWKVAGYRADFLLGYAGAGSHQQTSIIVECDGHEWHEKTKAQAQKDKERERVLNSHVAKVIRFTGSEINARPIACFQSAMLILEATLYAWMRK